MLEKEYQYYQNNKPLLDSEHDGKFIVIVGENVLGEFEFREEAIKSAISQAHQIGTFLVQFCTLQEDQTQQYHSRVVF